jgi:hypothetical protein
MTVTFEQARETVAKATGRQPADYGWQNDQVFVVAFDYGDEMPPLDEPDYLVDKTSGQMREVTGLLGLPPAPDLRPIGNPPE